MRPHRRIRRWVGWWLGLAAGLHFTSLKAAGQETATSDHDAVVDSSVVWLPDPAESSDAPERRGEPPEGWRVRAQAGWGGVTPSVRRIWWSGGATGLVEAALASDRARHDGGLLWRAGSLRIGAGALAVPNMGLSGETASLVRRERGFGAADAAGASWGPRAARAAPGSGADVVGLALAWNDAVRIALGGLRRGEGDVLAFEVRHRRSAARCVLVRADEETAPHAGFGIAAGSPAKRVALEASLSRFGVVGRVDAAVRGGPMRGAVRWRYEQGRTRPGALDLEAAWVVRDAAARFRWRSWSPGGIGDASSYGTVRDGADDGRAEIDLRAGRGGNGATLLRLGTRPRQADGSGGERYAIGDMVVAREPGRALRLTAGHRSVQVGERWRRGRAMGAVLEVERRRRALFTLTAEVVHADDGAGAYGQGLDVAGGGSLRARTRTGLRAAARGWIEIGAWRCGAAVDNEDVGDGDETTARETRAPRVNLWLAWSGGSDAR